MGRVPNGARLRTKGQQNRDCPRPHRGLSQAFAR
jgi:hypothetical protein